ncbi:lipopolysaccharide biosynthesis protein [Rhizobium straminoryzae]|uniref:Oligosaccharide flippase family protein n=1 Tax=Rhizobium straminoryzae TaxID=1387186 RepID=A0A549TB95_9HYPH|nr:hypothetical protein [Rhizobium straminoryzae]TRL39173.1 hypothetical protein FNA46_10445 [Rhizobium straminoryzae]
MKLASLKSQFTWGVFSQGYSQAVTIGSQLLVLPLMVTFWGAEKYGSWLIISALPSYLSMADLGFAQISANDMTMRMARGDARGALVVNQTAWLFNLCVTLILIVAFGLFVSFVPLDELFSLKSGNGGDVRVATFVLGLLTLTSIVFGVIGAGMRSVGLLWAVVSINATSRLTEAVLLAGCAYFDFDFLPTSLLLLANRSLIFLAGCLPFYRKYPQFMPGLRLADFQLLRRMVVPSVAYMSYTASYALNIQGVSLLVGAFLGPVAVVVINAIRTLTRLGRTAASIVISSLEPIFAQLSGSGEASKEKRAFQYLIYAASIGTLIYVAGMWLFGESFLAWWTRGTVVDQSLLFHMMLLAVVFEIAWYTLQTPFVSTNRHSYFALWLLILSVLSIALLWLMIGRFGLAAAGAVTLMLNGSMVLVTVLVARKHSKKAA